MIGKVVHNLVSGAIYIPRAVRLLVGHPRLWLYCIAPIMIALLLGVILIALLLGPVASALVPQGMWAGPWYLDILTALILCIAIVASAFLSFALINVIAGPFNELLSQRVEEIIGYTTDTAPFRWKIFWQDSLRAIREEIKTLAFLGSIQLGLLLLNLIPVIGSVVYMIIHIPVIGLFMAYEYLDLPLSRNGVVFSKKIAYIRKQPIKHLGFGWICAIVLLIPIINIVFLPVCVIAGTLLYCEHEAANNA